MSLFVLLHLLAKLNFLGQNFNILKKEAPKGKKINNDLLINQASEIFTKSTLKKIHTKDSNSRILESNYNSSNLYKSKNLGLPGDSNKNLSSLIKYP